MGALSAEGLETALCFEGTLNGAVFLFFLEHFLCPWLKPGQVERCWGILEKHWNGAKRVDAQTMLEWAIEYDREGHPIHPVVELSRKVYKKGVSLSKEAMPEVEARLE